MDEMTRLQRKLIPVNIVVMVLALVAAISILVAPLLTVDVGTVAAEIAKMQQSSADDSENGSIEFSADYFKTIAECLNGTTLSFSTVSLAKTAFSDAPAEAVTQVVAGEIKKSEDKIVAGVAVQMLPQLIESGELDVDIDVENIDVEAVMDKFDNVLKAGAEESDGAINELVDEIRKQAVSSDGKPLIGEQYQDEIADTIKELYRQAKDVVGDEELTMESFICITISKLMNENGGVNPNARAASKPLFIADDGNDANPEPQAPSENTNDGIYTTYEDLLGGILSSSGGEGQSDPTEELNSTINQFKPFMQIAVYAMFGFAGIWLILFVFACIHLFLKNKRFTMWYVKLFGFYPCLIFGVLPLIGGMTAGLLFADAPLNIAAIIGAISSLTWISGACYLALWIVSVFWAFPIKRRIRDIS